MGSVQWCFWGTYSLYSNPEYCISKRFSTLYEAIFIDWENSNNGKKEIIKMRNMEEIVPKREK